MIQLLKFSLSPFGRCNRSGLLRMTCALLAIQAVVAALVWLLAATFHGPMAMIFKSLFLWLGFCATAKRLHDMGLSAWWVPSFFIALILWSFLQTFAMVILIGPDVLHIYGPMFWLLLAGIITPVLAVTIWLHYAPGQPNRNIYGSPPGQSGISHSAPAKLTPDLLGKSI